MAPVMSYLRALKHRKGTEELEKLLQRRSNLVAEITKIVRERETRKDVRGASRNATYRFFVARFDFLMRHGEIEHMLGVSSETFSILLGICKQHFSPIPNKIRVAVFLKFCKEGISENQLAHNVGLSQPTVSRIVVNCIKDLVTVANQYIVFPQSKSELREMRDAFATRKDFGVPCFAVLDGKHWRIDHPPHTGSLNYNYKAFYSFNSLFVSDSDLRIIYIQLSKLGINSDAQMFRDGPLGEILEKAVEKAGVSKLPGSDIVMPPFILSDNGFALSKMVMAPYRNNQLTGSHDIRFNEIISATRVKVENLFGVLTSKFQIFGRNLRLDPANSRALIIACSVIHNISLGKLVVTPASSDNERSLPDPYRTPEEQRTALKHYLLSL